MDPDAQVQKATLGTALYYRDIPTKDYDTTNWIGSEQGAYTESALDTALASCTRVYGLASTPDFGGQPNTIDTTTLDNTKTETNVLGLQPAAEVSYEINMMDFDAKLKTGVVHNLRAVKALADDETPKHWILVKASGVIIEYDAITTLSYTADAQQDIEKFNIYHDVKSAIRVSLPSA